jgi:uncharacterized protein
VLATGLVLGYGAASQRWLGSRAAVPASLAASAGACVLARRWGTTWSELGLDRRDALRGTRIGMATVPPIAAVVISAARHPRTRRLFADERVVGASRRKAAYEMLLRIPVATAATEELMFRGVILSAASTWLGVRRATVYSSLAFGLWHVLPAFDAHRSNPEMAAVADRLGGQVASAVATVGATTAAGILLCRLRVRGRSLVAPVIFHAAVNGLMFAAARARVQSPSPSFTTS